jgi:hypothetical protein
VEAAAPPNSPQPILYLSQPLAPPASRLTVGLPDRWVQATRPGSLFLAIGVAADLVALVLPSRAASARQRATALLGWVVWLVAFVFAVTASIGFASTNISDVTLVRASRPTPAVTSAQAALTDAIAARDRECKGGAGKFCREREAAVAERRQVLDAATTSVGQAAAPQTVAAIRLVAWASGGTLRPAPEDICYASPHFIGLAATDRWLVASGRTAAPRGRGILPPEGPVKPHPVSSATQARSSK